MGHTLSARLDFCNLDVMALLHSAVTKRDAADQKIVSPYLTYCHALAALLAQFAKGLVSNTE